MKKEKKEKSKKLLEEFKIFIQRGNVLDLAVGVIIGSAFSSIVNSIVNDILMPVIGVIVGGLDFSSLTLQIGSASIKYGIFINNVINFLIIAICIFVMVKILNKILRKKEDKKEVPIVASQEEILLTEIRDLLKEKRSKK